MMGHVRKAIMKLTSVIIVIAVTFITVSCSSQKKGTAYSVYFLNEDGTSLTEGRVYIESQDAVSVANELLEKMNVAKGRHTSIIKPVSVSQPTVEINGIYAGVYYDSSYYGMKPSTEVLYRASPDLLAKYRLIVFHFTSAIAPSCVSTKSSSLIFPMIVPSSYTASLPST